MNADEAGTRYFAGEYDNPEVLIALQEGSDENGRLYYRLYRTLRYSGSLAELPTLFREIVTKKAWVRWHWIDSEFTATSFADYITRHPPKGIGSNLETVKKLISGDPEAEVAFLEATTGKNGAHHPTDNISTIKPQHGTSRDYTLKRIKDTDEETYSKVVDGTLSANAAAKQLGLRKEKTPLDRLRIDWKKASASERQIFLEENLRDPEDATPQSNTQKEFCEVGWMLLTTERDMAILALTPKNKNWRKSALQFFRSLRDRKIESVSFEDETI